MSSKRSGSHLLAEGLKREGVTHLFGVPGESLVGLMDALMDESDMQMIVNRHEEGAAFAAEGFAKASGTVGVCFAARAVGVAHASIALHVAQQDSTPMVLIAGDIPTDFRYREAFQEANLAAFLAPVTKWQAQVERVDKIPELLEQAFRIARSGRPGPTVLVLPEDISVADAANVPGMTPGPSAPLTPSRPRPETAGVARAADLLLSARRPVILAGGGVLRADATTDLGELANAMGAPVYAAWRRFDVLDHHHPLFLGCLGLGVRPDLVPALAEADVVLVLGSRLSDTTTLGYRVPGPEAAIIQVDIDAQVIGAVRRPEVGLVADAGQFITDLLAEVQRRGFAGNAEHGRRLAWAGAHREKYVAWGTPRPFADSRPVDPEGAAHTMQQVLPPDTAIVTDAGNFAGWGLRYYRHRRPGTFYGPTAGSMGYALPAAMGIKMATPHRPVVAMMGDGGLLMTAGELETMVRHRVPVVALLFNNYMYGAIKGHQIRHFPGRYPGVDLGNPNFAEMARSFGAFGVRVESNADLPAALTEAIHCGRPAVVELITRPERLSAFKE